MASSSAVTEIFARKSALRKEVLFAAKSACKSSPGWRLNQSQLLSQKLWDSPALAPVRDVEEKYIDTLNIMDKKASSSAAASVASKSSSTGRSSKKPFCIGLYMSLWFELDVDPLLHRLLAVRELPQLIIQGRLGGEADVALDKNILDLPPAPRIFVPELVPSPASNDDDPDAKKSKNEMRFVEILNAADLDKNFAPVPPYNIREPPKAEKDPFVKSRGLISAVPAGKEEEEEEECHLDVLVVPGVAFDFDGNRLGKGGGYYDRWIKRTTPTQSTPAAAGTAIFVGVGFDEQLPKHSKQQQLKAGDADGEDETMKREQEKSFWGESFGSSVPMASGMDMPLDLIVTPNFVVVGDEPKSD